MRTETKKPETMWFPIKTAPVGASVKLGRWTYDRVHKEDRWHVSQGIARRGGWFGMSVPTYDGTHFTHWQPFPETPGDAA